ncbi:MAG TPA: hypothetical protein VK796_07485 [Cytophaga sp.]|jgi:hypothetical protein|nr:hypothetical protein [Cytophaga sp.]
MAPDKSEGNVRKGNWFVFQDGTNVIQIWGSNLNGKEKVFLNNVLVSQQRSLKKKSKHDFKDSNGMNYEVSFDVPNLLKGAIECQIKREGIPIKTFKATYAKGKNVTWQRISIMIISLVLVSILQRIYHFSDLVFFILAMTPFIIHMFTRDPGKIIMHE